MSYKVDPLSFGDFGNQNQQSPSGFRYDYGDVQQPEPVQPMQPEVDEQGIIADFIDKVQGGAWTAAADIITGTRGLLTDDRVWEMEQYLRDQTEAQNETLSQAQLEADKLGAFESPRSFMGALASGIGSIAPSMVAGGVAGIGGRALASKAAQMAGAGEKVQSGAEAVGQFAGAGMAGAPMIGGSAANQISEELAMMPNVEFSQLPNFDQYYQTALQTNPDDPNSAMQMARDKYTADAEETAVRYGAAVGAASMGVAAPYLEKILKGGQGILPGAWLGARTEAAQEGFESGAQEAVVNPLAGRDVGEGVAGAALEGAVLGGLIGGGVGGVGGFRGAPGEEVAPIEETPAGYQQPYVQQGPEETLQPGPGRQGERPFFEESVPPAEPTQAEMNEAAIAQQMQTDVYNDPFIEEQPAEEPVQEVIEEPIQEVQYPKPEKAITKMNPEELQQYSAEINNYADEIAEQGDPNNEVKAVEEIQRRVGILQEKPTLDETAQEAATSIDNELPEPTEAQKEAGNYKKAHHTLNGMNIAIENPKGSERKGKNKAGKDWSTTMNDHYGYFKGTEGFDKDHLDVFMGPTAEQAEQVYVVDQVTPSTGKFDEHKVMMGYDNIKQAEDAYKSNYDKDWKGLSNITEMPMDEFKQWAYSNKPKQGPLAEPETTAPLIKAPVVDLKERRDRKKAKQSYADYRQGVKDAARQKESEAVAKRDRDQQLAEDKARKEKAAKEEAEKPVVDEDGYHTDLVKQSYAHSSNSPGRAATIHKREFNEQVQELTDSADKLAKTPEQKEALTQAVDKFKQDYLDNERTLMGARSGVVSSHIAGRSKFNAKQAGRRGNALDRAQERFNNWLTGAKDDVERAVQAARTPEAVETDRKEATAKREKAVHTSLMKDIASSLAAMVEPGMEPAAFRPKATKKLEQALEQNEAETLRLMEVINKALKDTGGIEKAVGTRSKFWKMYKAAKDKKQAAEDEKQAEKDAKATAEREAKAKDEALPERDGTPEVSLERLKKGSGKGFAFSQKHQLGKDVKIVSDAMAEKSGDKHQGYYFGKKMDSSYESDRKDGFKRAEEILNKPVKSETTPELDIKKPVKSETTPAAKKKTLKDVFKGKSAPEKKKAEPVETKKPTPAEQPAEYTIDHHNDFLKKLNSGDITLEEFQASVKNFREKKDEILAMLNSRQYTIPQLRNMGGYMLRGDEKKAELAKRVFDRLESAYLLDNDRPNLSYMMGEHEKGRAEQQEKINKLIDDVTQADLDNYAQGRKDAKAKREADKKAREEAVKEPKSLDDFREFIRVKGKDALSPDQLESYDRLITAEMIARRKEIADREASRQARSVGDVDVETAQTKHTKTGEDLYVVKLSDRIDRERFNDMRRVSKQYGGFYSRYSVGDAIPGFQFKKESDRDEFLAAISTGEVKTPEKPKTNQERIGEMGDRLITRGEESLAQDRQANTARRAGMAASAEAKAESDIVTGKLLKAISEADTDYLQGITALTQLEELQKVLNRAEYKAPDELKDKDSMSRKTLKEGVELNDYIQYAEFPSPIVRRDGLQSLARDLEDKTGYKNTAKSINAVLKRTKDENINLDNHPRIDQAKIKKYAKLPGVYGSSTWIADYIQSSERLEKIGITSLPHLRMALRELNAIQEKVAGVSPEQKEAKRIKQMERELVGKKMPGFFPTPKPLVEELIDDADIQKGDKVLEPSAGKGDIADVLKEQGANVYAVEMQSGLRDILESKGHKVVGNDFMEITDNYDKIVMNPPFEDFQDIDHVMKAYELLNPDGRVVAVMGAGVNNTRKKATEFRAWVEEKGGTIEALPEGSFKSAFRPTGVNTVKVIIDKPAAAAKPAAKKAAVKVSEQDRKQGYYDAVSKNIFKDIISQSIQNDGQKLLDAVDNNDIQALDKLINKYQRDAGLDQGGIGAGPGKVKQAKRGASQIWGLAIKAKKEIAKKPAAAKKTGTEDYSKPGKKKPVSHPDFSFTGVSKPAGLSERQIFNIINDKYGRPMFGASKFKNVDIINDPNKKWRGVYKDGQITLNAFYMTKDDAVRILQHEKVHEYIKQDPEFRKVAKDILKRAMKRPNSAAGKALEIAKNRVPKDSKEYDRKIFEETMAYLVQYYNKPEVKGIFKRIATAIAKFFRGKLGINMNEADAVDYLKDMVKAEAVGTETEQKAYKQEMADLMAGADVEEIEYSALGDAAGNITDRMTEAFESDFMDTMKSKINSQKWGVLNVRQIADVLGKYAPEIKNNYIDRFKRFEADMNKMKQDAGDIAIDRQKLSKGENEKLAQVQHEATIASYDPSWEPVEDPKITHTQEELETRQAIKDDYEGLTDEAQKVYSTERTHHKTMHDARLKALTERINAIEADEGFKESMVEKLHQEFDKAMKKGPYFPLARFGQYWVSSENAQGVKSFDMFENEYSQKRFVEELRADPNEEVIGSGMKLDNLKSVDGVSGQFIADVDKLIRKGGDSPVTQQIRDDVFQLYLESLPELSARKKYLHRGKVKGFAKDQARAFAQKARADANDVARLRHIHVLQNMIDDAETSLNIASSTKLKRQFSDHVEALQDAADNVPFGITDYEIQELNEKAPFKVFTLNQTADPEAEIDRILKKEQTLLENAKKITEDKVIFVANGLNELKKSHEAMVNNEVHPIASNLNSLGFLWYLGASPAAALVNLTQTPTVSLPMMLADKSLKNSARYLSGAVKDFIAGKGTIEPTLNTQERKAFNEWHDSGLLENTQAHDLSGVADSGIDTGTFKNKAMRMISFMFHRAEVMNREVTALATYRAAKAGGATHEQAVKKGADLTWNSHLDYGASNRARFMRGNTMRVITQFKQYSQGITYIYGKTLLDTFKGETKQDRQQAMKLLGMLVASQIAVAGTLGLPMAGVVMGITQGLKDAFDDDDEATSVKAEFRQAMSDFAGQTGGQAISHGLIDAFTPLSMSGRLSMADLWVRTPDFDQEGKAEALSYIEALGGPMVSIFTNMFMGKDSLKEGNFMRAAEQMTPKMVKDFMRATRYATEGNLTKAGLKVKDMTPAEMIAQALGFSSSEVSEIRELSTQIKNVEKKRTTRRKEIIDNWMNSDDRDMTEIKNWNERYPRDRITSKTLRAARRSKMRYAAQVVKGVRQTKRNRDLLEEYDF